MPHKDPEVARAYRKANSKRRYENFKRWMASLTPEQLEALKDRNREYRRDNPERAREVNRASKLRNREKVLQRKRDYHYKNRDRLLVKMRENATKNRGQRRAACAEWYRTNRETALESARRYARENREKILLRYAARKGPLATLQCPHCGIFFVERRRRAHRFCSKRCKSRYDLQVYASNLRAAKLRSTGVFTKRQWQELKEYFGWRCAYCGIYTRRLTIEHVQPLSRGGLHDELNIVPACLSCNSRKQASNLIEFLFLRSLRNTSQNSNFAGA